MYQLLQFGSAKGVHVVYRDPVIAGHVRGWDQALHFHQFREFFRFAFEGNLGRRLRWFQVGYAEHFLADTKQQVVLPTDFLSCVRKREAKLANPLQIRFHAGKL